jgi:hypothetical protein
MVERVDIVVDDGYGTMEGKGRKGGGRRLVRTMRV